MAEENGLSDWMSSLFGRPFEYLLEDTRNMGVTPPYESSLYSTYI